jgi:hypothetical protein
MLSCFAQLERRSVVTLAVQARLMECKMNSEFNSNDLR